METTLTAEELQASRDYHQHREALRCTAREVRRKERLLAARRALRELAPREPLLRAVYLFGSILRPGCFGHGSDIDVAVDCADPAVESRFWRGLEDALNTSVDLRPLAGSVVRAVQCSGELVYARKEPDS